MKTSFSIFLSAQSVSPLQIALIVNIYSPAFNGESIFPPSSAKTKSVTFPQRNGAPPRHSIPPTQWRGHIQDFYLSLSFFLSFHIPLSIMHILY